MRRLLLVVCGALFALPIFAATAALPETTAVLSGSAYIRSIQLADGSYASSPSHLGGQTMDAIFAIRAAGYDPAKETIGGKSPADYLKANATSTSGAASAAKAALGAKALGIDPKSVGGTDLIAKITGGYDSATGTYAGDDFNQSIAMLGLACTGNSVPAAALGALKATQIASDGGWGFGGFSDPDTTAIAIQALLASGAPKSDPVLTKALAYLKASQGNDGGFGYVSDESNASSTAFVVQALLALGENPEGATYTKNGVNPVAYLLSQQNADGSFKGFDPGFATNQVVPALAGRTFCNAPETPITRTRPAATPTAPATPPPPAATTAAPAPPATGNTAGATSGGSPGTLFAALALVAAGGALAAAARLNRGGR